MTTLHDLTGKVALITGGSRGIGRAAALALAEAGANIAVNYQNRAREAEQVRSRVESYGRRCVTVRANVAVAADVARMAAAVEEALGAVAILVNNAGIARPQAVEEITETDWDEIIDVNLKSVFLVTQAVLPNMRAARWGRIINISSAAAHLGGIIGPHYTASKAGILGLTHSYASLLAGEGVTVNAIAPALIETDMIGGNPRARAAPIPVGRFGTTEEVAEVVVMLARNGYITGQTIGVNGGLYMS
ncbi:MAG TPA: SDR family NAD(P)-dependent oxidoreductase [Syntrophobacteria bacterium]|nr:SDR family NAD(P)-dependent oxidoreductase [Syntrophobacteria bacterium]